MTSGKAWNTFERKLGRKSASTQDQYKRGLMRFCEYWQIVPEELYQKQLGVIRGVQSGEIDPRDEDQVVEMVLAYVDSLKQKGLAPNTRRMPIKAIKFFFEANKLPFKIAKEDQPKTYAQGKKVAKKDQIVSLLNACHGEMELRNKAIIMTLKDSGLRPSDIELLTVDQYRQASEPVEGFKELGKVETTKEGVYAYPMLGPESTFAIDVYLRERESKGINIPELFHKNHLDRQRGKIVGVKGISRTNISTQIKMLRDYVKLPKDISATSLRKFHATKLAHVGMPIIARLEGKRISSENGVYDPYIHPEETGALSKAYIGAYRELQVLEGDTRDAIEQLKNENETLKTNIQGMRDEQRKYFEMIASHYLRTHAHLREDVFSLLQEYPDANPELYTKMLEILREQPLSPVGFGIVDSMKKKPPVFTE